MTDQESSGSHSGHRSRREKNPSAPIEIAGVSYGTEKQNDRSHEQPKRRRKLHQIVAEDVRLAEWIMIAFTAATAAAGIASAFIAHGQLKAMRGQLTEMKGSSDQTDRLLTLQSQANGATGFLGAVTDKLAQHTQAVAEKADAANVISQDTEYREVRSYLNIERVDLAFGPTPRPKLYFVNTGHSPARAIRFIANITPMVYDHHIILHLDRKPHGHEHGVPDIGANRSFVTDFEEVETESQPIVDDHVMQSGMAYLVTIQVIYRDVFGKQWTFIESGLASAPLKRDEVGIYLPRTPIPVQMFSGKEIPLPHDPNLKGE